MSIPAFFNFETVKFDNLVKSSRLLKNAHLLRFPHPSSLRRTSKYASFLRISGALHLGIFEQPAKIDFFSNLVDQIDLVIPSEAKNLTKS